MVFWGNMKKLVFFAAIQILFAHPAQADKSVDWTKTPAERIKSYSADGYSCESDSEVTCCKKEQETTCFTPEKMYFNCHVYGLCSHTIQAVEQMLINSGTVSSMKSEPRPSVIRDQRVCGYADNGDKICLESQTAPVNGLKLPLSVSNLLQVITYEKGSDSPINIGKINTADDGPEYFYVVGVKDNDVLNVRIKPDGNSAKVGEIPYDGNNIRNLGCNENSFSEWLNADQSKRKEVLDKRWCQVQYGGITGWVRGKFLNEQSEELSANNKKPTGQPQETKLSPPLHGDVKTSSQNQVDDEPPAIAKNPITVLDINWTKSLKENMSTLTKRGYVCAPDEQYQTCKKGNEEITFRDDNSVIFNCFVFNMCEHSLREAAQLFVDSTNVSRMEVTQNQATNGRLWSTVCGHGPDGDKVCLGPNLMALALSFDDNIGEQFYSLILYKGSLGKKVGFQ